MRPQGSTECHTVYVTLQCEAVMTIIVVAIGWQTDTPFFPRDRTRLSYSRVTHLGAMCTLSYSSYI